MDKEAAVTDQDRFRRCAATRGDPKFNAIPFAYHPYTHAHRFAELILELVRETHDTASTIEHLPKTKDDPSKRQPDITLAKEKLGWEPKVDVKEGLRKTIAYFSEELKKQGKDFNPIKPKELE